MKEYFVNIICSFIFFNGRSVAVLLFVMDYMLFVAGLMVSLLSEDTLLLRSLEIMIIACLFLLYEKYQPEVKDQDDYIEDWLDVGAEQLAQLMNGINTWGFYKKLYFYDQTKHHEGVSCQ